MSILEAFVIGGSIFIIVAICAALLSKAGFLKYKLLCTTLGWHHKPKQIYRYHYYDHKYGICPVCGKNVQADSNGDWF